MNFEKIEDQSFGPIFDINSDCACSCQGEQKPLSEGLNSVQAGLTQKGSCTT